MHESLTSISINNFNSKKMEQANHLMQAKHGIAGGILLVLLGNITVADVTKTAVLAIVGASVSFLVSFGLKWISEKKRK